MIARHEVGTGKTDIWAQLSAPLPEGVISWRQDGRAVQRERPRRERHPETPAPGRAIAAEIASRGAACRESSAAIGCVESSG